MKFAEEKSFCNANTSPQNVTSLPKRAKIVIPRKATEKFVPQHTERGWWEEERPLITLSLSYKAVYPGFPTGVANMLGEGASSKFDERGRLMSKHGGA